MDEERRKQFSRSTERNNISDDIDPLCLYIRQIPADFSQEDLASIVSDNGKRVVTNVRVIKKPNVRFCYGFAHFTTHKEALNALNEINGSPPLNLSVIFAKKKKNENEHKASSSDENMSSFQGRGRGLLSPSDGQHNVNITKENTGFASRGRGQRISLDGPISRIKVVADDGGRKVTVASPPKRPASACSDEFADEKNSPRDLDSISKVPNPFYFCFICGQEGIYSCKHCRKPYCSKNCQSLDFANHKEICKRAKEVAETLLCLYKNFPVQSYDSGVSESSNSDPEKLESAIEAKSEIPQRSQISKVVEKLTLSSGAVELVIVVNIETPSKFWIRLKKYSEDFLAMEKQLTSLKKNLKQFHSQLCVSPGIYCCTLCNNNVCRAKVQKVKSHNEILISLLDYGKTVTAQKCALCILPEEFRNFPAQAILCRLVSDENEIIQWNDDDTLSFELHTNDKSYKAHVFSCSNDMYDVSLINDDGIPLYSILAEEKKAVCDVSVPVIPETDGIPPSVWSKLKPGAKMFLIPTIAKEGFIWCYLTSGESDLNEIMEIEKLLQNYSEKDISKTAEEDEFAAGFSKEYKQYYRCRILKRMRSGFLVQYIDYGNEEEVAQLSCLSGELLKKCCYLVKCEKPHDLSIADFQKFMGDSGAEVTVAKVDRNAANLSFHYKKQYSVICYPCYSNSIPENETTEPEVPPVLSKASPVSKVKKDFQSANDYKTVAEKITSPKVLPPSSNISPVPVLKKAVQDVKAIAEKVTIPKRLLPSETYAVRIVFIKTASELYVQLIDDQVEMCKMIKTLNSFCNSQNSCYTANIGEIVSCKFKDKVWYRGKVLQKLNNEYRVSFVDYGNEDIVSENDIQVLSDRFISPQFSVCVSLSGVKNEDISKSLLKRLVEEDWEMKVINPNKTPLDVMLFQKNVPITEMTEKKNNKVKSNLKFQKLPPKSNIQICHEDDKYLYVNQVTDLKSLQEMSAKLKSSLDLPCPKIPKVNDIYSGLFTDGLFYRVSIEEIISSVSCKVCFIDYGNNEIVAVSDLRELPNDIFALPVYCVPVQVRDRKELTLNMNDEYTVEVIGMENNVQRVKFLNLDKSSSLENESVVNVNEAECGAKDKSSLTYKKIEKEIVDVKISYMDSKLVYVQLVSDSQAIEDLLVKLNSSLELLPVMKPVVNKVYCGLCSDGVWYRVSVEEVTSSNTYKVYFFDFGNYEDLSAANLKELPNDLFSVPVCCIPVIVEKREDLNLNFEEQYKIQAIGKQESYQKVKFINCQKQDNANIATENKDEIDVDSKKDQAKPKEIEKVPHISSLKKQKLEDGLNEVKFCHLDGNIYYCQLSSDSDQVLNMIRTLQKCGREGKTPTSLSVGDVVCAQSSDSLWYRACILCDKKSPSYKVLFFDYGNAEAITRDCIKILPIELLNFPVFAIPMKIENADKINDIDSYTKSMLVKKIKEINGDTYVVELQLDGTVNSPKISTLKKLTLPKDVISNVTICHIDDSLYYVQPTSNIDNLAKLTNKLLEADTFSNLPHSPEEGDIVCAKFVDDMWYRCAVKKVYSNKVEVCFIDYGNSDSISIDGLKVIPLELSSYAIASIPVKFKNEEIVRSKILENIHTVNVKVCDVVNNIQVVDIVSQVTSSDNSETETDKQLSYTPTFLSSFTKSTLSLDKSCKVVFKMNLGDFYIATKLDDHDDIRKLNSVLEESKTDLISHSPSVNEVLLAKKNNLWYRCSVLSTLSEENVCKVYFVDLGSTEDAQKCTMRNLPDACKTYPLFAIKISIQSDQPVTLDKTYNIHVIKENADGIYYAKVYHQYKYSSISRKELMPMKESDVIFYHKEGGKYFLQDIADIESLTEVQKILAGCSSSSCMPYKPDVGELVCAMSQLDNSWYRGCIEEVLSSNEYKVFFIDYGNCENVQEKHLQPMPLVLTKFPSLCIPVKFVNNEIIELEKIYKVMAESKASNNVQIVKLVEDNDKVITSTKPESSSENLKKCDDTKKFLFSSCKFVPFNSGEQDIVIYSVDDEGDIFCAPYNTDNIQANLALPGLITDHCNSKGVPFNDCEPEAGEMVLALYPLDNNWYRAVVIQNLHPQYDVNFVDYGNTDCVNITSLRKMEEEFMELDIQARMCSLSGFTFSDENSTKVYNELKKFDIFSNPEPLRANVKIIEGEITINVPAITSHLLQQKLVTADSEK